MAMFGLFPLPAAHLLLDHSRVDSVTSIFIGFVTNPFQKAAVQSGTRLAGQQPVPPVVGVSLEEIPGR
jgi:hypothetical protein